MAVVNETIGTNGRDRSTITLWNANDGGGDGLGNDDCIGSMYDDSVFDEGTTIYFSASSILLTVASGERHDGTEGTGARIVRTASATNTLATSSTADTTVLWQEVDANGQQASPAVMIGGTSDTATKDFGNFLIHGVLRSDQCEGLRFNTDAGFIRRSFNGFIYDIAANHSTAKALGFKQGSVGSTRIQQLFNVTIQDISNAGSGEAFGTDLGDNSANTLQNLICTDAKTKDFDTTSFASATADHNLSSDTTASGTGSLTEKAAANQFVSTASGSEDLHLKSGADAINAGTDLGTTPSGVEIDIDGRDRDAEGDTWDMGAHEFVAAIPAGLTPSRYTVERFYVNN